MVQSLSFGLCSLMILVGNMDWTVRGWSLHSSASSVKSKRKRVSDLSSLTVSLSSHLSIYHKMCLSHTSDSFTTAGCLSRHWNTPVWSLWKSTHFPPPAQVCSVTSAVLFFLKGFYCSLFNHKYIMKFCDDAQYQKFVGVCIVSCVLVSTVLWHRYHSFHLGFVCIKTACT